MAKKYHINPETGEVGKCRAFRRCPFEETSDHFDTPEEARRALEIIYEDHLIRVLSSPMKQKYLKLISGEIRDIFDESFEKKIERAGVTMREEADLRWRRLFNSFDLEDKKCVNYYCSESSSARINNSLAKEDYDSLLSEDFDVIQRLDDLINQFKKNHQGIVFQGIRNYTVEEKIVLLKTLKELNEGDVILLKSYVSSSFSLEWAIDFARNKSSQGELPIVIEIVNPEGLFINESVEEVVIPRNSKFVFLGYREHDEVVDYVSIRLLQV